MELGLCAPCLFGLEGPLGNELRHMGMKEVRGENGRVHFTGTEGDIARANIRSRFAERIYIEVGRFEAKTFDELFDGTQKLSWEQFIPKKGAFPVKGHSLNSALHSVPDCQRIIKKAVSMRLGQVYGTKWLPEEGETYQIGFAIFSDQASLYLDTSGVGLHKRGYRPAQVTAPLRETLAAALVDLAGYRGRGDFCDPFCGSGTIAIEAALTAKGRAPGINRAFAAERWGTLNSEIWRAAREEAVAQEYKRDYTIIATDIDSKAVEIARQNAKRAGVEELIRFKTADARAFSLDTDGGVIVTNPPYGERLMTEEEARQLMHDFGKAVGRTEKWAVNIISSDDKLETFYGSQAAKVRKLYNGMIRCWYYMFKR